MRKPEEIRKEIKSLEKELSESIKQHQYRSVEAQGLNIGFFNTPRALEILRLLYEGAELQYRHEYYGNADVYMNPQKNRILVENTKNFGEDIIMNEIVWDRGKWFKKVKE